MLLGMQRTGNQRRNAAMIRISSNLNELTTALAGKIQAIQPGGSEYEGMSRRIGTSVLGIMKTRIHEQGQATNLTDIGKYSTKPIYITFKQNPGRSFGKPTGKTGLSKFKSGKRKGENHRSKYFAGGYNQFKTEIGRNQLGKVNLSLSGQLNNQLTIVTNQYGFTIGWPNAEMKKRADALEKKYGKPIWDMSEKEREVAIEIAGKYTIDAVS